MAALADERCLASAGTGCQVLLLAALGIPLLLVVTGAIVGATVLAVLLGFAAAIEFGLRFVGSAFAVDVVLLLAYLSGSGLRALLRLSRTTGVLDLPIYFALIGLQLLLAVGNVGAEFAWSAVHASVVATAILALITTLLAVFGGISGAYRRRERTDELSLSDG
jgi:hypothetical protein